MPSLAITFGWIMAETGRWPWIVYGLQKVENAASPNVSAGNVWFSLISMSVLYGVMMVIGAKLALEHGKAGPDATEVEAYA